MEKIIYDLWLKTLKGVGNKTQNILIREFETSQNIYNATKNEISVMGGLISEAAIDSIINNKDITIARELYRNIEKSEISVVSYSDELYPNELKNIYDPPLVIYYKGNINRIDENAMAIVGARKVSPYGKYVANELGKILGENGVTVVSGMAYGVDAQAHKGALEVNGFTIAVLGCGVDVCYPKTNKKLMEDIEKKGVIISEYGPGTQPIAQNFPGRNRIISGLSKGVIVVEASIKSGSLITSEFALEQGKEVYAIPGNINNANSEGTNKLIKDGAIPLISTRDILEELHIENEKKYPMELDKDEIELLNTIKENQPVTIEKIVYFNKKSIPEINGLLTILEIKGLIEVFPGKIIIAK